ncbi:hypothetical protein DF047_16925 [Burkholderia cenocepacia]|nr:hypothetical protein DF047_16925 [Burkholderia cenocepacia]
MSCLPKESAVSTAEHVFGNHEFIVTTVPVVGGGYTITIVHREFHGDKVVEAKFDSDIVYPTEEDALEQGGVTARDMAARHGLC